MQNLPRKIGGRIREIRKARGLTQERLAEKVQISPRYFSRLEVGQQGASIETLAKVAAVLEVELWELFDFGHDRTAKELQDILRNLIRKLDEQKLRLAVRMFRAVLS